MTPTLPVANATIHPEIVITDESSVRIVALNRPQTKNGLTMDIVRALKQSVIEASRDTSVRALVVTGEGGSFCSGLDLRQGLPDPADAERLMRENFQGVIRALDDCPQPTLAFIDGPAAGFGVSLALACDIRVASDRAQFAVSFSRLGLCPDGGATWLLPRAVGIGKALELMLLAERIDAAEALRIGLVQRVYPSTGARADALALAARLAKGAPISQRLIKQLSRRHLSVDLAAALENEVTAQMQAIRTRDFGEGFLAFMEKREPTFTGQ